MLELLAKRLVCPSCASPRVELPEGRPGDEALCDDCLRGYPVDGGVLDAVPDRSAAGSLAQLTMQSELVASVYESRLWRRGPLFTAVTGMSFEREVEAIVELAAPERGGVVLDVACGTGVFTRLLAAARPEATVVGLDFSRPMLARAARAARAENLTNVVFVRADAAALPFRDDAFDVVTCCAALHLFRRPDRALAEMARVLASGGRAVVSAMRQPSSSVAGLALAVPQGLLGLHPFATTELETLCRGAGFARVEVCRASWLWLVVRASKRRRRGRGGRRR